jgi:hypothetical protein
MKRLMARPTSPAHPKITALQALMQPIQDGLDDVIALIRTHRRALVPTLC